MTIDVPLLWELQTKTTEARTIEEDLNRMPQQLERARGDLSIREGELKAVEAGKQAFVVKRKGLEKEIEGFEQKITDNLKRQGQAKTNAELDAMKKEGLFIREQKSALETQVLEMFDQEAAFDERIAAAKEKVEAARRVADQRAREIQERESGLKAEHERLAGECAELAGRLRPDVRGKFEQLLKAKNGVAIVTVQRGACGGCFNSLPPQFVNEVRKADRVITCEGCGRIIVSLDPPTGGDLE